MPDFSGINVKSAWQRFNNTRFVVFFNRHSEIVVDAIKLVLQWAICFVLTLLIAKNIVTAPPEAVQAFSNFLEIEGGSHVFGTYMLTAFLFLGIAFATLKLFSFLSDLYDYRKRLKTEIAKDKKHARLIRNLKVKAIK